MKIFLLLVATFSTNVLFASPFLATKSDQNFQENNYFFSITTVYSIPDQTYQYLSDVFNDFHKKISFNTSIKNSTFQKSNYNEIVSLPLIADNKYGMHFEIFGNLADPNTSYLSNLPSNIGLYNYYTDTGTFELKNSELALGAGFSIHTSPNTKLKLIISDGDLPGYGSSNALFGIETIF